MKYTKVTQITILAFLATSLATGLTQIAYQNNERPITGHGNPSALQNKYDIWKKKYEEHQGAEILTLPLSYAKAFSRKKTTARAVAKLNLLNGGIKVNIKGINTGQLYAFWLVGGSKSEPNQSIEIKIGRFKAENTNMVFSAQLERQSLHDFYFDRLVLTQGDQASASPALITGTPGLFQRIYYSSLMWPVAGVGQLASTPGTNIPFSYLLPKPAFAGVPNGNLENILGQQVALGRELFVKETFGGNGRTCATCHRLDNNHTIDPNYIAKLPKKDPIFVHETNPDLVDLENPDLVRQLALFKANMDGFDKPAVFRAAQHTLSLGLSMDKELPVDDPDVEFCEDMLGWSGDGAPDCGSLRMFAAGAIIQHLPKTLIREEGTDFRLPTAAEADALEAYMLSLGRQTPWNLDAMSFVSPIAETGKQLFNTKPADKQDIGTGECKGCHFQAGAVSSSSLANGNRNTGIEDMPNQMHRLIDDNIPFDGGFADAENHDCGIDNHATCYGNKKFSMVDAFRVDTAPFFHNHSISTIEEAVAFYNSDAFNNADDRVIKMETSTVIAIAQFLRTLSAVDNIDSAQQLLDQAITIRQRDDSRELILLAIADTKDAKQVLKEGQINANPQALKLIQKAMAKEKKALASWGIKNKDNLLNEAKTYLMEARDAMILESS